MKCLPVDVALATAEADTFVLDRHRRQHRKQVRGKLDAHKGAEIVISALKCGTGDGRGRHFRARPPPPPA